MRTHSSAEMTKGLRRCEAHSDRVAALGRAAHASSSSPRQTEHASYGRALGGPVDAASKGATFASLSQPASAHSQPAAILPKPSASPAQGLSQPAAILPKTAAAAAGKRSLPTRAVLLSQPAAILPKPSASPAQGLSQPAAILPKPSASPTVYSRSVPGAGSLKAPAAAAGFGRGAAGFRPTPRLPWFRAHVSAANDPGRLLSVHLVHTALVSGWASGMLFYELITLDPGDPVYNPPWRQGSYVVPLAARLGVLRSDYAWSLGLAQGSSVAAPPAAAGSLQYLSHPLAPWTYEAVLPSHLALAGALLAAGAWHWAYWDLNLFAPRAAALGLDLSRILGIHLLAASALCCGFGLAHLSGSFGPGAWTSDSFGLAGSLRVLQPSWSVLALAANSYGVISAHHASGGAGGLSVGLWHAAAAPARSLDRLLRMGNTESLLASTVAAVGSASALAAALLWYGSATLGPELAGPTRFHWDSASFCQELARRVGAAAGSLPRAWEQVPDKLVLYDYLGSNPSKGGLFRAGPMLKADGLLAAWLGHASFSWKTAGLAVRRVPAFFERFPLILIDQSSTVRADIAFRRAESSYSIEERKVRLCFSGGVLGPAALASPSLVKAYARKAQFGEVFRFSALSSSLQDGVFRTSPRGWYSFSHVGLWGMFWFGHLWHAGRALFRETWAGVSVQSLHQVEYGRSEKLGGAGS